MVLKTLFTTLLCVSYIYGQNCPSKGISSYNKQVSTNTKQRRLTTIQNGNYTVQALITFTSGTGCDTVSKDGLVKAYAIKYSIEKVNRELLSKYNTKLGMQLDDVCRSLPTTMARGIEVVSLHRPNSVCRADFLKCDNDGLIKKVDVKQATAVIGTQMSFTTIPLASLMSLYYIPQVSYAASSRLLSKKDLYKSFFRTIPSDTNQISVMLDIFKKFNWNYVFAIGSDDDYGKLGVSDLKREALKRNVCISHDEYIPYQSTKTKTRVAEVVAKIKDSPKAQVVVLFCYVEELGDYILEEAHKQGVKRVWLTSEAWNPLASTLPLRLKNQTHGLMSVSLKSYKMPKLLNFMQKEIEYEWNCSMWLIQYLKSNFNCTPDAITSDKKTLTGVNLKGSACEVDVSTIMEKLAVFPGKIDNLIDSVTALGHAAAKVLQKQCGADAASCYLPKMSTHSLTEEMFNVSFVNEQKRTISFDAVGDPKSAFYTVENLQYNKTDGTLSFVPVGNWTQKGDGMNVLNLDENQIQWPVWFTKSVEDKHPFSRCSKECKPGEAVVGRTGCCWGCAICTGNNYTDGNMQPECKDCGNYSYTRDNKGCTERPILWLEIMDPAGMSITVLSGVGFIGLVVCCYVLLKLRRFVTPNDMAPYLTTISCCLLFATLVFGPLHVTKPTHRLCQARNSIFFLLLMMYSAVLLIRSKFMIKYLQKHADKSCRGNLLAAQCIFLFLLFLLELVSVIAWLYIDKVQLKEFRQPPNIEIWIQCEVSFTAARLVSTFIPCIILIIATFCAFRERNLEHSFYEPKFLSFTCIAMCIIIVAFLPTFKYVVGIYKAIVMAFTMDVFGFTFVACLVLPKLYVAVMRNKRGAGEYPLKPGTESKKKENEKEKVENIRGQSSMPSNGEITEISAIDSSIVKNHSNSTASIPNGDAKSSHPEDITLDEKDEEGVEEREINGYTNATYDKSHDAHDEYENGDVIVDDDKPPPYEEVLNHENTKM